MASVEIVSARYAIGVGGRSGVDAVELAALVREAAAAQSVDLRTASLAALDRREDEEAFRNAAQALGLDLMLVQSAALLARAADVLTHSPRVEAMFGVGSVAEALALVAAGQGSRLLAPRAATARLTCAIARACEEDRP
jgi:cobalt-precorrin 5A hydrolase